MRSTRTGRFHKNVLAWVFTVSIISLLPPAAYATQPCYEQDLDAYRTNQPLYPGPWPIYNADTDLFGGTIAVSGETMAVGSPYEEHYPGYLYEAFPPAVYVYVRSNGVWQLQQKLAVPLPSWLEGNYRSNFGFSVALDGDTLVVGDPAEKMAWIYERSGEVWSVAAWLTGAEFGSGITPFGHTVSVSGDRVVVGDSADNAYYVPPTFEEEFFPGYVWVFLRTGGVWSLEQTISPGDPPSHLLYGPVAISGNTLAIFRIDKVIIYHRGETGWSELQRLDIPDLEQYVSYPHSISLNEAHLVAGTGGSVHVFANMNGSWSLQTTLNAGSNSFFNRRGYFGTSTALDGDKLMISDINAAHVYEITPTGVNEIRNIDLYPYFYPGPLGGYSPTVVGLGNDIYIASDTWPLVLEYSPYSGLYLEKGLLDSDRRESLHRREIYYFSSQDVLPPSIYPFATVSPSQLWPPNHQMVDITVSYGLSDNCSGATAALTVTSDEPVTGGDTGDTAPDWEVIDAHHLRLRAERAGSGDGRTYTIRVTATDEVGNSTWQTVQVAVPHN